MKCDRCGTDSFDTQFVQYTEDNSMVPKSGWLCNSCRNGVKQ